MIDLHTHIVACIDDGAETIEESVRIVNAARLCGTKSMVLTPHYNHRQLKSICNKQLLLQKVSEFVNNGKIKNTDMNFYIGAENYCGNSDIFNLIEKDEIISINNSKYVLIEFSTDQSFEYVFDVVSLLNTHGYIPVLAHAERYVCLQNQYSRINSLKKTGCKIQINSESVLGQNNYSSLKLTEFLMENKLVDIIASDVHDLYERSPDLSEAHAEVCLKYSVDYAEDLLFRNPQLIVENKNW
ncbi:MAG: CpsB/CapC family capsule biosynthesis tyrosine phosphatase [Acutalibacteraceae bacterium]|nr:CpsB/CapC family capsule biosynthesis tyrosine phosphatase [Acutalibacteraceae bacterium]